MDKINLSMLVTEEEILRLLQATANEKALFEVNAMILETYTAYRVGMMAGGGLADEVTSEEVVDTFNEVELDIPEDEKAPATPPPIEEGTPGTIEGGVSVSKLRPSS